jgi:hypothetical protein
MNNFWISVKTYFAAFDTPFWEGLKTVARPLIFALLVGVVEYLIAWLKIAHLGVNIVLVATVILTWLDSYLHNKAKKTTHDGLSAGILPL